MLRVPLPAARWAARRHCSGRHCAQQLVLHAGLSDRRSAQRRRGVLLRYEPGAQPLRVAPRTGSAYSWPVVRACLTTSWLSGGPRRTQDCLSGPNVRTPTRGLRAWSPVPCHRAPCAHATPLLPTGRQLRGEACPPPPNHAGVQQRQPVRDRRKHMRHGHGGRRCDCCAQLVRAAGVSWPGCCRWQFLSASPVARRFCPSDMPLNGLPNGAGALTAPSSSACMHWCWWMRCNAPPSPAPCNTKGKCASARCATVTRGRPAARLT